MIKINKIFLAVSTRRVEHADSNDKLRLFSGFNELLEFGTPPDKGKTRLFEKEVDFEYDEIINNPFFLGLTGDDKWAPRHALLWGHTDSTNDNVPEWVLMAQNLWNNPNSFVSQDSNEGFDRWPLLNISILSRDSTVRVLVLLTETLSISGYESATAGPLEFSLFSTIDGIGTLTYQTILSDVGLQKPAEKGGVYMLPLSVYSGARIIPSRLNNLLILNRSDDGWIPGRVFLFGLNSGLRWGRVLAMKPPVNWWVSQEPHEGNSSRRAFLSLSTPANL